MYYARRIFDIDTYTKDIMQHISFSSEYSGRNQVGRRLPMRATLTNENRALPTS